MACLSKGNGVRCIGFTLFVFTLGLFIAYLIFIEDIRRIVLEEFYGIAPCSQPIVDIVIDSLFEYSLLVNALLCLACSGCTRWILIPWLTLYFINTIILGVISVYLFINPLPLLPKERAEFQFLRLLGLVPLALACFFTYCWIVTRNHFSSMSSSDKNKEPDNDGCCKNNYKTAVQITAGCLTIFSSIFLVLNYIKLEDVIEVKYERMFRQEAPKQLKTIVLAAILTAITVNLLAIFGSFGSRWRRILVLPWLVFYGIGVLIAVASHQWLTTLCWVEEKIYGLVALCIGFITLIVWTAMWIVAAEAAEKPKMLMNRNPLGFQRL